MKISLRRLAIIALASFATALAVDTLRPEGSIPLLRPSQAELARKAGITPLHLDTAQLFHKDSAILFVDARPASVFKRGHIPHAVSLPEEDFDSLYPAFAAKVPKDRPLVVYCDGVECRASEVVSRDLKDKGYKYIHCFFGGWIEWRDAKLEIEK
jgi:rhodanese-related sulfurtransferase